MMVVAKHVEIALRRYEFCGQYSRPAKACQRDWHSAKQAMSACTTCRPFLPFSPFLNRLFHKGGFSLKSDEKTAGKPRKTVVRRTSQYRR
jgi:hypothetical protein